MVDDVSIGVSNVPIDMETARKIVRSLPIGQACYVRHEYWNAIHDASREIGATLTRKSIYRQHCNGLCTWLLFVKRL